MKFTFTEKKMGTSEELRSYTERKVGKLDRFFKTESSANITFSMERGRFLAEITVSNNGLYYRASELTNDMYASVDSGVASIERQIRKNKTRLAKRLRQDPSMPPLRRKRMRNSRSCAASASPSSRCQRKRQYCR